MISMPKVKKVCGRVMSGVGKGRYYVKQKPYFTLFKSLLNHEPYLGTLNIEVSDGELRISDLPHRFKPCEFGEIKYALGEIGDLKILVLRPVKSIHPENVFEIVAPINLREHFRLRDGDKIEFKIYIAEQRKRESP